MNLDKYLSKYLEWLGRFFGQGQTFYVDLSTNSWHAALVQQVGGANVCTTLADAVAKCLASRGDRIVVFPGTHTLTGAVGVSKAGITIEGIPGAAKKTLIVGVTTASTNALNLTAADILLRDLTVKSGVSSGYAVSVRAARCTLVDCILAGNVVNADGVELQNGADDCTIQDCLFEAVTGAASALGVTMLATAAGAPDRFTLERCSFRGWTTMLSDAGSDATAFTALKVRDCDGQSDAGTLQNNYIKLDTFAGGKGAIETCRFATPTNSNAVFVIPAGVHWVANATEAGISTARPA